MHVGAASDPLQGQSGLQQSFPSAFGIGCHAAYCFPSRKYDFHLAGARIDDGNQLFDHNITESREVVAPILRA